MNTIKGDAIFSSSKIKSLGNIQNIMGSAHFEGSIVISLGDLQYIGQDVDFTASHLKDTGKLEYIGGSADFTNSFFVSLGVLNYVGEELNLAGCNFLKALPDNLYINNVLILSGAAVNSITNLKELPEEMVIDSTRNRILDAFYNRQDEYFAKIILSNNPNITTARIIFKKKDVPNKIENKISRSTESSKQATLEKLGLKSKEEEVKKPSKKKVRQVKM